MRCRGGEPRVPAFPSISTRAAQGARLGYREQGQQAGRTGLPASALSLDASRRQEWLSHAPVLGQSETAAAGSTDGKECASEHGGKGQGILTCFTGLK